MLQSRCNFIILVLHQINCVPALDSATLSDFEVTPVESCFCQVYGSMSQARKIVNIRVTFCLPKKPVCVKTDYSCSVSDVTADYVLGHLGYL